MPLKLHRAGFDYARRLIGSGQFVFDERDLWSEHQPSTEKENAFIERQGTVEYGRWHLAIDDEEPDDTKRRYKFPYGDFQRVHRCGLLSAESRAGQYKHYDVERAAAHLHGMIDAMKTMKAS
jgi:hypothetical protein